VFSDNGASAEDISGRQLHQAHAGTGAPGSYLAYGDTWATVSNTPLRGHKGTTFEGGIRAPLIAHWPNGGLARGQRDVTSIASVREIMPMLLAAADGAPAPLLEALRGTPRADPPPIFWAHAGWAAVRDGDWKAVRTPGSSVWQLFNLRDDPTESRPLTQPALLADLTARWSRWAETTGVDPAFDPRTYYQQLFRR
jgi:arylsulfatase